MLDYHLKQSQKFLHSERGRRIGRPAVICVVLALFVAIYFFYSLFFSGPSDLQHDDYIVFLPVQDEKSHTIVHEIICPKGAELCFKVEDYMVGTASHLSTRYERRLMVETVDEVVLSVAELVPKPGESFNAENTQHWAIRKMQLLLPYTRATIGQMFATGCIQLDSANQQRTLMIGLGGAAIPNFLVELGGNHEIVSVELEPAIDYIAHKWFGLEKSPKQKVLLQDGLDYINGWNPRSGSFDCIIIDACRNTVESSDSEDTYPLVCPIARFVNNEQIVKKMFNMLKSKGTIIINTFAITSDTNEEEIEEERQFQLELFRHHFGHCYYADVTHNKLLVCSLALSKRVPMTNELYASRIKQLPEWLQKELGVYVDIVDRVWNAKRADEEI